MDFRRRTILHLVHRLTFGGAERVLVNYLNGSSQSLRHVLCSFFPADSFVSEIKSRNVEVVDLDKKKGNDLRIPFKLARICRQYGVDVIHCQGWGTYLEGLLCAGLFLGRIKFVFAFHGKTIADLGVLPRRRIWAQRSGAVLGNAIITPSEEMRLDYAQTMGIDPKRIHVIHNGVDIDCFCPGTKASAVRKEFNIGEQETVMGCVARFDPVKNFPGLINAFAAAKGKGVEARLLLVGDGPQMEELRALVNELGLKRDVLFAGRRTDVPQCLQAMDIYIQPSFYEGFSMTILEAMSSGLPVIAFDVGGTHEMLVHGVNGLLLQRNGDNVLEEAMIDLAEHLEKRREMGQHARAVIEERFSLAGMINKYDQLFASV
jgi:sugar transferase (PEP-CTERM/EpsH1 system associated)